MQTSVEDLIKLVQAFKMRALYFLISDFSIRLEIFVYFPVDLQYSIFDVLFFKEFLFSVWTVTNMASPAIEHELSAIFNN